MRRVLVTGSTGFIGRYVMPQLGAEGWEVVGARRADADLREPSEAEALVARVKPTHLLHLAWNTEHGRYWTAPDNEQWADGSVALARAFAKHGGRRLVGAGTCAEYDWTAIDGPCDEIATPLHPRTIYGRAKLRAFRGIARALDEAGVSSAWARLFFLYGPGEDERRLVPSVLKALSSGQRARVSAGTQIRDFLHVADAARAFATLLGSGFDGAVNVGSGIPVSIREVVETIARHLGRPEALDFGAIPIAADDPPSLVANIARLAETGWRASIPLDAGLADYPSPSAEAGPR